MVRPKRAVSNAKKQKSIESSGGEPVAPPTASEETSEQHTQNTNETRSKEDDVPPTVRKRRLASLNAEYLVHYCSTTNNHNSNTNENANNHHSGNSQQPQTNNTTNTGGGGANKRRRTISSRATTTNDDESTNNKAKRRSTGANKKVAKEAETEEEQEEEAVVEPVKRKTSLRGKRKKKEEEDEEEKTEDEEEEEKTSAKETGKRGRRNGRASGANQSKKAKEPVVETFVSSRPRREAGLRASAMIIQTNEIEKSNRAFQFIHSAQNTVHNGSNGAEKKLKSSPKSNKVEKSGKEIVNKKHQQAANNNHTFQVPQAVSVFAASQQRQATAIPSPDQDIKPIISNAGGGNSNIMSHVNLLSKKKQLSAAYTSNNNLSNNSTAANSTFPLRQISTCTTMGSLSALAPTPGATVGNDQDSSSNEVTIVAEKSGNLLNGVKSPVKLTEASLAEHNRLNGTTSGTSGASTFSNHTKEHINRWAAEHAKYFSMTGEPFKADYVPIESFGIKTHNDPQHKTQSGGSNGNGHHAAAEKNMVASSVGKTNLTGKLSGVVGAGGASGIKQDPHIKLNETSMLNTEQKIKPVSGLKHTASFPNLTTANYTTSAKVSPHMTNLSNNSTMAQLNTLANAINVTLQKQSPKSKQVATGVPPPPPPTKSYPYTDSFGGKMPTSSNKINEATVTEANVNKLVAAAFAAAAVNAAAAAAVAANASTSKATTNVTNHRFAPSSSHHHQPVGSGSNNHSSNSHLSLFQQHLNSHLVMSNNNNNVPIDHHHNSIKSTVSMPSLASSCPTAPNATCSNNRSQKQDIYHQHHHPQSFPLMSTHPPLDSHKMMNSYISHSQHHHHHTDFLKSMNHPHASSMSSTSSHIPHHHHHHHIHEEAKIKAEKQTYLDQQTHHHHHMPPPVINVENLNFYGTLPPSGSSKCDKSDELKLVAKFNLGKSSLCAKTSCDSCCTLKSRHQSLSPPSHRSCSNPAAASATSSKTMSFNDSNVKLAQNLTAESVALNLAKLFNQAAAVASSRMEVEDHNKLKLETKSNSNVSSSLKAKHNSKTGNESSMHAEKDETDSVVSVSSSSSSVKHISVHSKSDEAERDHKSLTKPLDLDQEETKAPSIRSSNSSVNLIVDESNNNNSMSVNNIPDDDETNLTKKSQLEIKESEAEAVKDSSPPSTTLVSNMDLEEQIKPATKLISVDSCDNSSSMQAFTGAGETLASPPSNTDKEATSRSDSGEKKPKNWKTTAAPIIETEEETTEYENGSSEPSKKTSNLTKYYASVKNHQTELEIKLNDFVMIESNIDLVKERNSVSPLPPTTKNESSDVLNETSHSNYSLSESEMAKQDYQQTAGCSDLHEYVLQIKSIWADSLSANENLMISGKIFLRPSQLNEILDEGRVFDQNELIEWIDFENRVEMFSVDCVKCKCEVTIDTDSSNSGQRNLFCNYEYDFKQRELRLVDKKVMS